jgi:hypothetical protein
VKVEDEQTQIIDNQSKSPEREKKTEVIQPEEEEKLPSAMNTT